MDNLKTLKDQIERDIDPNGSPGSILALNHRNILFQVLEKVGKYTGSPFIAQKNATVFQSGTFSWNGNALNNTADFVITVSKKTADLNDVGLILQTMVLGDIIQFKDYNGRAVFLKYQSHVSGTDASNNPVYQITVKGLAENPNYIYQDAETAVAVLSYHKKLVDATPAISNDAGNIATIGSDGKIYVPAQSGTTSVENRFTDIADLTANQTAQSNKAIQYVGDATADPSVDSGWAYYEYLGTTTGDLTDYRKLSEQESLDLIITSGAPPTQNTYADIAGLTAGQADQDSKYYQFVTDATADATVNSGWAIYQKQGTSTGALTDYIKIMEQESMDVPQHQISVRDVNGVEQFKITDFIRFDNVTFDPATKTITPIDTTGGGGGTSSVENRYLTIAELLAGQGSQTDKSIQYVADATADPTVETGFAYYEKLSTTTGALSDYRKLSEKESIDDDETVVTVSASRSITNDDHRKILVVDSTVSLTIPSSGIRNGIHFEIDVLGSGNCTLTDDGGGVTLDFPDGKVLEAEKMATIYRRGSLNNYRGKGGFTV